MQAERPRVRGVDRQATPTPTRRRAEVGSESSATNRILDLQSSAGNAATAQWIARAVPTVARQPAPPGADAGVDVLTPPLKVLWGSDPFTVTLARSPAGDSLDVTLRYDGPHPFEGIGVTTNNWTASINVGAKPFSARLRSQGQSSLLIDLYGDASNFLRIKDDPELDLIGAEPGRRHGLSATLTNGGGLASSVRVRDPAAKASDIATPVPDDRPGISPQATSIPGDFSTSETALDGDGDQRKELVLRLGPETKGQPGAPPPSPARVRLGLRRAGGDELLNVVGELAPPATELWPIVREVTDGDRPTRISLVLPMDSQWLTIAPPKPGPTPSYGVRFAGFDIAVPAGGAQGQIGHVAEAGLAGGIIYNDVKLGAYDDMFRLTLQWRSADKALLGLSPLFRGHALGGVGLEIPASGTLRCQVVETAPTSVGFDLDGDGKTDLRLYDQLTTPSGDLGEMPERDRNHRIRMVGAAVGGEQSYDFSIRSGNPQMAGFNTPESKAVASNAMAVTGLNEQRRNASYAAQLDQYEIAMMRVRADAATSGAIGKPVYDAWRALSEDMIKLRPQLGPDGVLDPATQEAAAGHAAAFYTALAEETKSATTTMYSQVGSMTKNEYTGEKTTSLVGQGPRTTGPGPELAGHIRAARWQQAYDEYQTVVTGLDKWLVKRLEETKGEHSKEAEEAKFLVSSRGQLAELEKYNPTRVLAVFHPNDQFSGEGGYVPEIPLSLYYYRDGDTWYLKNLTNPDKPHHYKADAAPGQTVPPPTLFTQLDDTDRLPEGIVHYEIPGQYASEVTVRAHLTWRNFLTWLGIGLALVGLTLVTAGTGTVAVAGSWALAGSAVAGGLSAALDLADKAEHGDLTATTAIIDIAQIVGAVAGVTALRAGMLAKGGMLAAAEGRPLLGAAAQGAVRAQQIYIIGATTRIAADVVTVVTMGIDTARQLDEIEAGTGTRDSKDRAKALLLAQLAVTGGLTAMSIKGELPALGNGRRLTLYTPKGENVPRALVEGVEAPGSLKFSQKDVGEFTGDKKMTIDELSASMRAAGWNGQPIHVIELPDGSILSLDNRRLWAAHKAELASIPVIYHAPSEPFPAEWAQEGFTLGKNIYRLPDNSFATGSNPGAELAYAKGAVPTTYGEAALFRTADQGTISGGGGKFPLWGRYELPKVRRKTTVAPPGSE